MVQLQQLKLWSLVDLCAQCAHCTGRSYVCILTRLARKQTYVHMHAPMPAGIAEAVSHCGQFRKHQKGEHAQGVERLVCLSCS